MENRKEKKWKKNKKKLHLNLNIQMYVSWVCKSARLSFRAFNLTMIFSFVELNVHFSTRKKSKNIGNMTYFWSFCEANNEIGTINTEFETKAWFVREFFLLSNAWRRLIPYTINKIYWVIFTWRRKCAWIC